MSELVAFVTIFQLFFDCCIQNIRFLHVVTSVWELNRRNSKYGID
jgi:hypothetical protein